MNANLGNGNHVCFKSGRDDWQTPQKLFEDLNGEFHFGLDAAASIHNSKCGDMFLGEGCNSLEVDWKCVSDSKPIWLNPPYSQNLAFIKKAYTESLNGAIVVVLIPSRTDTIWWHDYIMKAAEIRLLRGRLYFDDAIYPAPFPSAIAIFNNKVSQLKITAIDARKYRNYTMKNCSKRMKAIPDVHP